MIIKNKLYKKTFSVIAIGLLVVPMFPMKYNIQASSNTMTDEEYRQQVYQENYDEVSSRIDLEVCNNPNALVNVPDPKLSQVINDKTKAGVKPKSGEKGMSFKVSDLQKLSLITSSDGYGISDLTGLQCATNLKNLDISHSDLEDVDELILMKNLTDVKINDTKLNDLSGMVGLDGDAIARVNLNDNWIEDVTPLANLGGNSPRNIQYLELNNNLIKNIDPLGKIRVIQIIKLDDNLITGALPEFSSSNLSQLHIDNNSVDDISSLKNVTWPSFSFSAENNEIYDLSPLAGINITTNYGENVHNQIAWPPIQEIHSDKPIIYTIYDENGVGHEKNLGVPKEGMNVYNIDWDYGYFQGEAILRYNLVKNEPTIKGIDDVSIEEGTSFDPLQGVSASDLEDGDLTSKIVVDDSSLDVNVPGDYFITYSVSDSDGNLVTEDRKVTVTKKTVPTNGAPVISGADDITIVEGEEFDDREGVKAIDNEDGDLTDQMKVFSKIPRTLTEGVYDIKYSVEDSDGNKTDVVRKVTVKAKGSTNTKPELYGVTDKEINIGDDFNVMDGISANDLEDGDLTSKIVITNNDLDNTKVGNYLITYSVSDSDGNTVEESRNIKVVDNNTTKPNKPINPDKPSRPVNPDNPSEGNGNIDKELVQTGKNILYVYNFILLGLVSIITIRKTNRQ